MSESTSAEIYRDIKKIIKKLCLLAIVLCVISLVIFAAFQVHNHFDKKDRERNILSKALPFTTNHKPSVYTL